MTRVGIIETGHPPDEVMQKFGGFPRMFMDLFSSQPDLEFAIYNVENELPFVTDRESWIITGSPAGVYEKLPWIEPVMDFIKEAGKKSIPVLGICFGHQLMAQAYGGVVKKTNNRGIGVHNYTFTEQGQKVFAGMPAAKLNAVHQDQIVEPPADAALLAASEFCPYAALSYGKHGLSMQGHPEFPNDIAKAIVASWQKQDPAPDSVYDKAMETLGKVDTDSDKLVTALSHFLAGRPAG